MHRLAQVLSVTHQHQNGLFAELVQHHDATAKCGVKAMQNTYAHLLSLCSLEHGLVGSDHLDGHL